MKKISWILLIFLMSSFMLYAEKEYKPNCAVYSLHELMPHQPIKVIVAIFVSNYPSFKLGMGSNRTEIIDCAKKFGMVLQYRKCDYAELMTLTQPVIVSIKTGSVNITSDGNISITNHFVVVKKATEDKVFIISNTKEEIIDVDKFIKLWAGYIIEKI